MAPRSQRVAANLSFVLSCRASVKICAGLELEKNTGGLMTSPLISVVMPVHNALQYLDESIGSILNQTFTDFEFVIDEGTLQLL